MPIFKGENRKNLISYLVGLGLIFCIFAFLIVSSQIGFGVKERCQIAQKKYNGDCVAALIKFLDDSENDFRSRNSAVWALGQLGDKRALPTLDNYLTGEMPEREPLDQSISQYEVKKAIRLIENEFNISAWVWRDDDFQYSPEE